MLSPQTHSTLLPLLLLLLSSTLFTTSFPTYCYPGDQAILLKIKAQFGNPDELHTWAPYGNCCDWAPAIGCTNTGRVNLIALFNLNVSAPVPPAFGELSELRILQLDSIPGMSGPIPWSFARLSHLEVLDITGTAVSGPVPAFLAITNLSVISLSNNKLSGRIPQALARLSNLGRIDLTGNSISGTIPRGLLHGDSRLLVLGNNQLTGEIPRDYGDINMDTVIVSNNQLTGDPSFLFGAGKTKLVRVDLSGNAFEFDLTNAVFPPQLAYLDLSRNRITGSVPVSLKNVIYLGYLDLSNNQLCGPIPAGGPMWQHDADCYANNKCLCGNPLPPCQA